jgi:hypothetical protein
MHLLRTDLHSGYMSGALRDTANHITAPGLCQIATLVMRQLAHIFSLAACAEMIGFITAPSVLSNSAFFLPCLESFGILLAH